MAHVRIFKHYFHMPYLLLGLIEGVVFAVSVYVGAGIRFYANLSELDEVGPLWTRAVIFSAVMLISMTAMGVYQARFQEGISGVMLRTAISYFFGSAALSMIFYMFPDLFIGRGVLIIAALVSFFSIVLLRMLFDHFVSEDLLKKRVLVLGTGYLAHNIESRVKSNTDVRGFILSGFIPTSSEAIKVDSRYVLKKNKSLLDLVEQNEVDEIVIAVDDRREDFPLDELLDCKLSGVNVIDMINFFEREACKIEVSFLHPSWLVFSDGFVQSSIRDFFERGFDVLASLLLLLVTWPIMAFTALAILFEDGLQASILYRQRRVGLEGQLFYVYKFRSMRENAEQGKAQWAQANDNRVTRVGKFIRKYRVDELPQILNVLRGDMGFVGPRPERPEFVDNLNEKVPFYKERHRVKPGITGWAQLCYPYGASEEDAEIKLKYDLYYVKNRSLMLDFLILIQTVEVILFGKGAR